MSHTASRVIAAPAAALYAAHLDPEALATWRAPTGMRGRLLAFDPREGGVVRMVLEHEDRSIAGKSGGNADVFEARYAELVPDERIVEVIRFRSDDPAFARPMRMTTTFEPVAGGTRVTISADDVPAPIGEADHVAGMSSALENLAAWVKGARI